MTTIELPYLTFLIIEKRFRGSIFWRTCEGRYFIKAGAETMKRINQILN